MAQPDYDSDDDKIPTIKQLLIMQNEIRVLLDEAKVIIKETRVIMDKK